MKQTQQTRGPRAPLGCARSQRDVEGVGAGPRDGLGRGLHLREGAGQVLRPPGGPREPEVLVAGAGVSELPGWAVPRDPLQGAALRDVPAARLPEVPPHPGPEWIDRKPPGARLPPGDVSGRLLRGAAVPEDVQGGAVPRGGRGPARAAEEVRLRGADAGGPDGAPHRGRPGGPREGARAHHRQGPHDRGSGHVYNMLYMYIFTHIYIHMYIMSLSLSLHISIYIYIYIYMYRWWKP